MAPLKLTITAFPLASFTLGYTGNDTSESQQMKICARTDQSSPLQA
jgi:hypothetical protein